MNLVWKRTYQLIMNKTKLKNLMIGGDHQHHHACIILHFRKHFWTNLIREKVCISFSSLASQKELHTLYLIAHWMLEQNLDKILVNQNAMHHNCSLEVWWETFERYEKTFLKCEEMAENEHNIFRHARNDCTKFFLSILEMQLQASQSSILE